MIDKIAFYRFQKSHETAVVKGTQLYERAGKYVVPVRPPDAAHKKAQEPGGQFEQLVHKQIKVVVDLAARIVLEGGFKLVPHVKNRLASVEIHLDNRLARVVFEHLFDCESDRQVVPVVNFVADDKTIHLYSFRIHPPYGGDKNVVVSKVLALLSLIGYKPVQIIAPDVRPRIVGGIPPVRHDMRRHLQHRINVLCPFSVFATHKYTP